MSFLKFWGKKDKKDEEEAAAGKKEDNNIDPEVEKRRLRHSLSISRSGRFKQKKRERGQILDKPELFDDQCEAEPDRRTSSTPASPGADTTTSRPGPSTAHANKSSPQSTCRDVNSSTATGRLRVGQTVVT